MFSVSGDTMSMMDADQIDLCTITWTAATYVIANLQDMLPREGVDPPPIGVATGQQPSWHLIGCLVTLLINALM